MDNVALLNSAGGIVTHYTDGRYKHALHIVPYVETVSVPVLTINAATLYGSNPEDFVKLTYSSGAALTFFCDSVAGGEDSSGDGSFDNPWRSMKTAEQFLRCAGCTLRAAAPFIQLKVKGDVDYISSSFDPGDAAGGLIISGWNEKCDLGSAPVYAKYLINLSAKCGKKDGRYLFCDALGPLTGSQHAISSYISGNTSGIIGSQTTVYNCSGNNVSAMYCYGGKYEAVATDAYYESPYYWFNWAFSPSVSFSVISALYPYRERRALGIGSMAVSADVSAALTASITNRPSGYEYRESLFGVSTINTRTVLKDCNVSCAVAFEARFADQSAPFYVGAWALAVGGSKSIISGGNYYVSAYSYMSMGYVTSEPYNMGACSAAANCFRDDAMVYNAACVVSANAVAQMSGSGLNGSAIMEQYTFPVGNFDSCFIRKTDYYTNGVVTSSDIYRSGYCS